MPKQISPVPLVVFRQIKKPGVYSLGGAKGLYLRIRGNSEDFLVRYQDHEGRRHFTSIGFRRSMSLSEARAKANKIHADISQGIYPVLRQSSRRVVQLRSFGNLQHDSKCFGEVMELWVRHRTESNYWKNDRKEPAATVNMLKRHALPVLQDVSVENITIEHVRDVILPIWTTKTVTAKKVLRAIRAILVWAQAMKFRRSSEDVCSLSGPLGVLIEGARKNAVRKDNFAALPFVRVPLFIKALFHSNSQSQWMLMFAILTASRMKAVRLATWSEVNFETKTWEIPPEHDKVKHANRDRTIMLSSQAIEVLHRVRPNNPRPDELIFHNDNGDVFSDAAATMLIRRMHEKQVALDHTGWIDPIKSKRAKRTCIATAHGTARSGFRTWAKDDRLGNNRRYDQEAAEMCLLHGKNDDEYDGAYDRASLTEERRQLMDDWGKFCFSLVTDETSVSNKLPVTMELTRDETIALQKALEAPNPPSSSLSAAMKRISTITSKVHGLGE